MKKGLFILMMTVWAIGGAYSQCNTVSNWLPGEQDTLIQLTGGGYMGGNNYRRPAAFAEMFTRHPAGSDTLTDVLLRFGMADPMDVRAQVKICVWGIDSYYHDRPGAILTELTIPVYRIKLQRDVLVHFDSAVVVPDTFFVGYELLWYISNTENLALYHTPARTGGANNAWFADSLYWSFQFGWKPFDAPTGWGAAMSLAIEPMFCPSGHVYPMSAVASAINTSVCFGDTTTLLAPVQNGSGTYQYLWQPSTGLSDSTSATPVLTLGDWPVYAARIVDLVTGDTIWSTPVFFDPVVADIDSLSAHCRLGNTMPNLYCATTGGSPGYSYQWSNGGYNPQIISPVPGYYSVTVTDANGCTTSDSVTLNSYYTAVQLSTFPDTCTQGHGSAVISSIGQGFNGIGWKWSNGSTDSVATGFTAGSIRISITDTNSQCHFQRNLQVNNVCAGVSGRVYIDLDQNGTYNSGDFPISGARLQNATGNKGVTDALGRYLVPVDSLGNDIIYLMGAYEHFCYGLDQLVPVDPVSGQQAVYVSSQNIYNVDFIVGYPPTQPCGEIKGVVFQDLDSNGIQNGVEPGLQGVLVGFAGSRTYTNQSGQYVLDAALNQSVTVLTGSNSYGRYCLNNANINYLRQVYPPNHAGHQVTLTPQAPVSTGNNFGMLLNTASGFDASVSYVHAYNMNGPGNDFSANIGLRREGYFTTDCYLKITYDTTYLTMLATNPAPHSTGIGYVEFYYPAWQPAGNHGVQLDMRLAGNTPSYSEVSWSAIVNYGGGTDNCPDNDSFFVDAISYPVINKRDQANALDRTYTRSFIKTDRTDGLINRTDTLFSYLIQFHNNTGGMIQHLMIKDTLPEYLVPESVTMPGSNKQYSFAMDDDGVITIIFSDLQLFDESVDPAKSDVFVQFNVRMKSGLPGGTVIKNGAAGYINHSGEPVFTNYAEDAIAYLDGVDPIVAPAFKVFPNPTTGLFNVQLDRVYEEATIRVVSLTGALVSEITVQQTDKYSLNLQHSGAGIYFIEVTANGIRKVEKLVVTQ